MLHLILVFLFIYFLIKIVKFFMRRALQKMVANAMFVNPQQEPQKTTAKGRMVQCAMCAVFIPENTAIMDKEKYFCEISHRDAFRKNTT